MAFVSDWTGDVRYSTCTGHVFGMTPDELDDYLEKCHREAPEPKPEAEQIPGIKLCTRCQKRLDESEFYKDKYSKSGLSCACKLCERKRHRKRRAK